MTMVIGKNKGDQFWHTQGYTTIHMCRKLFSNLMITLDLIDLILLKKIGIHIYCGPWWFCLYQCFQNTSGGVKSNALKASNRWRCSSPTHKSFRFCRSGSL